MKKEVLSNGLTVLYKKRKSRAIVVEIMVKTGSNHEKLEERGISHFLEHILFEGTLKRPSNWHISNEIEKIGGDFNAYTTNERTNFYIKVLRKHFKKAVDVLADILQNPLLKDEDIEREKNIVLKEIEMVNDEPRFYQWILLQKNLFKKHPCRNPTYGEKKQILALNRKKIWQYFQKHYVPNNMIISIIGDVPNWKKEIEKKFSVPKKNLAKPALQMEILDKKSSVKREKRNIANSYMVIGFKTVPKKNKDAYALEVINGILGRGQSGKMFTEIRSKRGLAYDVGTQHVAEVSFGYFAIYACVDKKNVKVTKEVILKEIKKLKDLSNSELQEAKEAIEGEYFLDLEDSQRLADQVLFWEQAESAQAMNKFIRNIKKVSPADIKRVIDKYFKNHTFVVLEGK